MTSTHQQLRRLRHRPEICLIYMIHNRMAHTTDILISHYRDASVFFKKGPQRIGSTYKKAVYKQYSNAAFTTGVAKQEWLGYLGPLLMVEEGDTLIVHLKNMASRPYSIHPHGLNYSKRAEGEELRTCWNSQSMVTLHWCLTACVSPQEPYTQMALVQRWSVTTQWLMVPWWRMNGPSQTVTAPHQRRATARPNSTTPTLTHRKTLTQDW